MTGSERQGSPFDAEGGRPNIEGDFLREEVRLANRNSGILLEALRHDVTPTGLHYLLNHFDVPYVPSAADWTLSVTGRVRTPLKLTMAEIQALPAKTLRVTLECAGNGRANIGLRRQSMPWMYEAVGTSEWTGTPLRHVLDRAGLLADAMDIAFLGIDRGFDKIFHEYGRSLTPQLALNEDVLLVWGMNGAPLLPQHGFPLRLIVPGWYGMASVKWLDRIEVLDSPFQGHQQVGTYVYKENADDPGVPVTHMRVKSLMVPPGIPDWYTRHRLVPPGPVTVFGRAWSGNGVPVTRVELGVDGHWQEAALGPIDSKYAWRSWQAEWAATEGEHEIACRATDANGDTQPLEERWDRSGFGNNMVHRIGVTVRA
jgi:DMSO/TMAO reductase YedYZ molybdopterin-dependent catalytic subunit